MGGEYTCVQGGRLDYVTIYSRDSDEIYPCVAVQLEPCRLVLLFGLVVMIPSVVLLCFFDDSKTLGAGSDPVLSRYAETGFVYGITLTL